jgi:hypothetical protein
MMESTDEFVRRMLVAMNGSLPDEATISEICKKVRAALKNTQPNVAPPSGGS